MWSVWLVFCDCGFHSVCCLLRGLWKLPDGRGWPRGKLNLVLMGRAMLTSLQSFSRVQLFTDPWTAACQASLSITNSQSLLKLNVHNVSDAIQPFHPVICFCSYLQSYPASVSFPTNQFFTSGGQSIGVSASVLPMSIQDWFQITPMIKVAPVIEARGLSSAILVYFSL